MIICETMKREGKGVFIYGFYLEDLQSNISIMGRTKATPKSRPRRRCVDGDTSSDDCSVVKEALDCQVDPDKVVQNVLANLDIGNESESLVCRNVANDFDNCDSVVKEDGGTNCHSVVKEDGGTNYDSVVKVDEGTNCDIVVKGDEGTNFDSVVKQLEGTNCDEVVKDGGGTNFEGSCSGNALKGDEDGEAKGSASKAKCTGYHATQGENFPDEVVDENVIVVEVQEKGYINDIPPTDTLIVLSDDVPTDGEEEVSTRKTGVDEHQHSVDVNVGADVGDSWIDELFGEANVELNEASVHKNHETLGEEVEHINEVEDEAVDVNKDREDEEVEHEIEEVVQMNEVQVEAVDVK